MELYKSPARDINPMQPQRPKDTEKYNKALCPGMKKIATNTTNSIRTQAVRDGDELIKKKFPNRWWWAD
jgi:hypothetical protein